ncbi:hypothetical protein LJB90_01320 [Eubacteriales bacterium OttesenSCG-928-G02]|nr:hypothetical protein [Eubacteriales bacterium OttesenSCG-928-G02]
MKKIIVLMMALLLVLPLMFACSDKDNDSKGDASQNTSGTGDTSEPDDENEYTIAFEKYKDKKVNSTVTIYTFEKEHNEYGELQFVFDEELGENAINEAVKKRNDYIRQTHGIEIAVKKASWPTDTLEADFAGGVEYDIICADADRLLMKVNDEYFYTLDNLLDLDDPWWDNGSKSLSIDGNVHFLVAGDGLITDVEYIYLYLFNKKVYNERVKTQGEYGELYDIVKNGEWTMDLLYEMAALVSEYDSDGQRTYDGFFGHLTHTYASTLMMNGAGIPLAEVGLDGKVNPTVGYEHSKNVFEKVWSIMGDDKVSLIADIEDSAAKAAGFEGGHDLVYQMFRTGKGLFFNSTVSNISRLSSADSGIDFEFGVLPMPRYEKAEGNEIQYYSPVNRYHSCAFSIPVSTTGTQLEASTLLLNALGYYNRNLAGGNVLDAYYEVTLKLQNSDQQEDADMLDLIFASKMYDLGSLFEWGNGNKAGLLSHYTGCLFDFNTNQNESRWQSLEASVLVDIEATLQKYAELKDK